MARRQPVHPWLEWIARVGYATKGAIYGLIGALAVATALRARRESADTEGALVEVLSQPFGYVLTGGIAIGLAAYAVWRCTQAIVDTEGKGNDFKGLWVRAGFACSGLGHAALAWSTMKLTIGYARDDIDLEYDGTATLLGLPFGPWLVAAVGFGFIGFGVWQIYFGTAQHCRRLLETKEMSEGQLRFACRAAQFGLTARGIVFGIIGWFLLTAAREHDPTETGGLAEALAMLEAQPYGPALLGVVAAGLMAYGAYMFVESRFHRIRVA